MTRRVHLPDLAADAERAAKLCRTYGPKLQAMAQLLAARGWPTGGTGGSSVVKEDGDVVLTSVEGAATYRDEWVGVDEDLAAAARNLSTALALFNRVAGNVVAHGDLDAMERKNRQPGSGPCMACTKDVPGTENDRLRAGFCNACTKRWVRAGRPDRPGFIRQTQADQAPAMQVVDPTQPSVVAASDGGHGATPADVGIVDIRTTGV